MVSVEETQRTLRKRLVELKNKYTTFDTSSLKIGEDIKLNLLKYIDDKVSSLPSTSSKDIDHSEIIQDHIGYIQFLKDSIKILENDIALIKAETKEKDEAVSTELGAIKVEYSSLIKSIKQSLDGVYTHLKTEFAASLEDSIKTTNIAIQKNAQRRDDDIQKIEKDLMEVSISMNDCIDVLSQHSTAFGEKISSTISLLEQHSISIKALQESQSCSCKSINIINATIEKLAKEVGTLTSLVSKLDEGAHNTNKKITKLSGIQTPCTGITSNTWIVVSENSEAKNPGTFPPKNFISYSRLEGSKIQVFRLPNLVTEGMSSPAFFDMYIYVACSPGEGIYIEDQNLRLPMGNKLFVRNEGMTTLRYIPLEKGNAEGIWIPINMVNTYMKNEFEEHTSSVEFINI